MAHRDELDSAMRPDSVGAALDRKDARIAELEAAVLAAKVLLEPTSEATEGVWQLLDDAYHRHNVEKR